RLNQKRLDTLAGPTLRLPAPRAAVLFAAAISVMCKRPTTFARSRCGSQTSDRRGLPPARRHLSLSVESATRCAETECGCRRSNRKLRRWLAAPKDCHLAIRTDFRARCQWAWFPEREESRRKPTGLQKARACLHYTHWRLR